MDNQESIETLLETCERSLLEPSVRKSELASQLLADSFVEFGSSGLTYTKAQIIDSLHSETAVRITASEFRICQFGPDTALVTYRTCHQTEPPKHALRSSLWRHQNGKWQMVFHQGTLMQAQ